MVHQELNNFVFPVWYRRFFISGSIGTENRENKTTLFPLIRIFVIGDCLKTVEYKCPKDILLSKNNTKTTFSLSGSQHDGAHVRFYTTLCFSSFQSVSNRLN